jgi:hypothetical protein
MILEWGETFWSVAFYLQVKHPSPLRLGAVFDEATPFAMFHLSGYLAAAAAVVGRIVLHSPLECRERLCYTEPYGSV